MAGIEPTALKCQFELAGNFLQVCAVYTYVATHFFGRSSLKLPNNRKEINGHAGHYIHEVVDSKSEM